MKTALFTGARRCFSAKVIPPMKKAVIVSTSNDIFTNLALENWFYKHHNFEDNHMLMLWVNEPCVVIGRHQNPWCEANVSKLQDLGIQLARRNSGGGTVYHDSGNLNLTFFTPFDHYNRKTNLEIISAAIYKRFGLDVEINSREDLTLRNYKISGTASKLARTCAYHHCTLLVNANVDHLRKSLKPSDWEIKTKATKSVKSKIINLSEENPDVNVEELLKTVGIRYLNHNNAALLKADTVHKMSNVNSEFSIANPSYVSNEINFESGKFHLVTPNERNFPGLEEMRSEFADWPWVYERTPEFTVTKNFKIEAKLKPESTHSPGIVFTQSRTYVFQVNVKVEKGRVSEINIQVPNNYSGMDLNEKLDTLKDARGVKYSDYLLDFIERIFREDDTDDIEMEKQTAFKRS